MIMVNYRTSQYIVTSATKKRKQIDLPISQFIAVIILSLSVFLIVDFGRRAATGYRIHQEEERLEQELLLLQEEHEALLARQDYVSSDAYVEEIARNELKWSRAGEQVMVILPQTPQSALPPTQTKQSKLTVSSTQTPLEAWKALFFPED